jgi:lysophospholipid acyltransferase (LPLAT)-like uncharacterized protein
MVWAVTREPVLSLLAVLLLRALFLTVRLRLDPRALDELDSVRGSAILCFWHNRILAITLAFLRQYPAGRRGVTVLTSPSRDGELLARIMARLGMGSVRGSSSRRGATALRELTRLVEAGTDIAITPDGPRGPRYALGPGAILLAGTTGAPILPMHARFSRSLRMNTWDGFNVPLPFSTISVSVGPLMHVPGTTTDGEFEALRAKLEKELRDGAH